MAFPVSSPASFDVVIRPQSKVSLFPVSLFTSSTESAGRYRMMMNSSLVPRPSAALFLVAYVTFEPLSDKLAEAYIVSGRGSKVTYVTKAYLTRVQRSHTD